jgi:hypothetical protein
VEGVNSAAKLVAGFVLLTSVAFGQVEPSQKVEQWNTIGRLCGNLQHIDRRERRDGGFDEHVRALKHVVLRLYERAQLACCEGTLALTEVTTGRGGKFSFGDVKPGAYWLATLVGGREYKLPLRLEPRKDDTTLCSDQRFEVYDSGDFQIGKIITVD